MKKIYFLGDSISLHYGPFLKRELGEHLDCEQKGNEEELEEASKDLNFPAGANCGDSHRVLNYLRYRQENDPIQADYLMFNCGLHDIKTDPKTKEKQVPLEIFRKNLREIIRTIRKMGPTPIWVTITPVVDEVHNKAPDMPFFRYAADLDIYNKAASEIVEEEGLVVIDLYSFSLDLIPHGFMDHVHFDESTRAKQAVFIARRLKEIAG